MTNAHDGETRPAQVEAPRSHTISSLVPIAFAMTGVLIGYVAGLSLTPVVATLLPLLFAIIGGGVGFFAIHKLPANSKVIGLSLFLFSFFCFAAMVRAGSLRQDLPWYCYLYSCGDGLPLPTKGEPESVMRLASIKMELLNTDLSNTDIRSIFETVQRADPKDLQTLESILLHAEDAPKGAPLSGSDPHGNKHQETVSHPKSLEEGAEGPAPSPSGYNTHRFNPAAPDIVDRGPRARSSVGVSHPQPQIQTPAKP